MSPQVDLNAIRVHFEIIGERAKYHVTAKNYKTGEVINAWFTKEEILSKVQEWTDKGFTIWVSFNEIEEGNDSIEGVSKLCALWFDIDAKRADKSQPASNEEKLEALHRALKLKEYIEKEYKALGFMAFSGNGIHLFFSLPCFPLIGAQFRKEVNMKLRSFAKRVSAQAEVEIDNTYDLRRVSTLIGTYNQKIPEKPLPTTWDTSFYDPSNLEKTLETIRLARQLNQRLLEAILNEPIATQPVLLQTDAEFTPETLEKLNKLREKDAKLDKLLNGEMHGYKSRSEAEMALVTKLVFYGFTKSQIYYIMSKIARTGKWNEKDERYWNLTYEKAVKFNEEHKAELQAEYETMNKTQTTQKIEAQTTETKEKEPLAQAWKTEFGLADGFLYEKIITPSLTLKIHKGKIKFSREKNEVETDFKADFSKIEEDLRAKGIPEEDIAIFKQAFEEGVRRNLIFTKEEGEKLPEFASKVAKALLGLFRIVTLEETDDILFYSKGVYRPKAESLLTKQIESIVPSDVVTTDLVKEVLGHVRRMTYVSRERFNSDPNILNLKNGLLDLRTFELKKHTPKFLSTIQLPVNYDPNAKSELWEKVVSEDLYPEDIPVLQEAFGYALYPENVAQKLFVFLGEGANGKSLVLHVLEALIGKEHVANVSPQDLENNRFAVSQLFGKLVNIYPDLPSFALQSTGKLKALISGDSLTIEEKFKKPFSFRNRAKFFFSANVLPKVSDDTRAFYRRIVIINFPRTFDESTADPTLPEKLTSEKELSGILNWALEGLKRLMQNGFKFSYSKSADEIREIYTRASNPVKAFLDEETVEDPETWIVKQDLYEAYKDYVKKHKLQSPLSSTSFFMNVQKYRKLKTERKTVGGERKWVFVGIRLKNEQEKEEEKENEGLLKFSDNENTDAS
jgi:putative DNA primase/helicase